MTRTLSFFLLLIGIVSCSTSPEQTYLPNGFSIKLNMDKVFASSPEDSLFLRTLRDVAVDDSFNVYVVDNNGQVSQIIQFSENGDVNWTLNQRGKGPGDISHVFSIAPGNDSLFYIGNLAGRRIDWFSRNGNFIGSANIPDDLTGFVSVVGVLNSGLFVGVKREHFGVQLITFDRENEWVIADTFTVLQQAEDMHELAIVFPPVTLLDGEIVIGDVRRYQYTWYSTDGIERKSLSRDDVEFALPKVNILPGDAYQPHSFSEMYPLQNYADTLLLGGARWDINVTEGPPTGEMAKFVPEGMKVYDKEETIYSIDIFSRISGNLIASLDAEAYDILRVVASDSKGRIYAELNGDEPSIGRFTVELSKE